MSFMSMTVPRDPSAFSFTNCHTPHDPQNSGTNLTTMGPVFKMPRNLFKQAIKALIVCQRIVAVMTIGKFQPMCLALHVLETTLISSDSVFRFKFFILQCEHNFMPFAVGVFVCF